MQAHVLVRPIGGLGLGSSQLLGVLDRARHRFSGGLLELGIQLAGLVGLDHLGVGNHLGRAGVVGGGGGRHIGGHVLLGRRGDLVLLGLSHRSYFPSFSSSTTS